MNIKVVVAAVDFRFRQNATTEKIQKIRKEKNIYKINAVVYIYRQ